MRFRVETPDLGPVATAPVAPRPAATAPARSSSFQQALRGLGGAVDRGEALIAQASHGNLGGLDSAQLIALQAGHSSAMPPGNVTEITPQERQVLAAWYAAGAVGE